MNVFASNSFLPAGMKQKDVFLVASFLRRIPWGSAGTGAVHLRPMAVSTGAPGSDDVSRLPVQPLDQTMKKYLRSVVPFVDAIELEKTKKLVQNFCEDENSGKKLQKLLESRAQKMENWLSDWWLAKAYLEYRNPVIAYSSPGLVWPEQNFKNQKEQLMYAARVINAALDFNKLIEEKRIPQEKMKDSLLCMSQYNKVFGACRLPKVPADELLLQDSTYPSRNIIVLYNNHLFSLSVFKENTRQPLSASHFYAMLADVVSEGDKGKGIPVGVLTTENRDNWAEAYELLKKDKKNKEILEEHVEKALFVLCLEQPLSSWGSLDYRTKCSKLVLHGFGSRGNAGNRWYDKTIQFIVGAFNDGVGVAYEHSPAEGGPIGVLSDFVMGKTEKDEKLEIPADYPKPRKLEFVVADTLKARIASAEKAVDKICDELDVCGWSFSHFGKEEIKGLNVSPDSFVQIAIQLAFYKLHKCPGAQYESGSLRKFIYGRTDTIRTCSEEVVNFCKKMDDSKTSAKEKGEALRAALASHKKYAQEVLEGRGIDRHLFGLKILAELHKVENTKIFSDAAYQRSTYFRLSTSNVPTKLDGFMVYGPLVENGYACCYNLRDRNINFGTSAWSSCKETFLLEFKECLEESLLEMKACLSGSSFKSKL